MKSFSVTIRMGRSDILESHNDDRALQSWLQDKLEHATSLLDGRGQVQVERIDASRADVALNFTVRGKSVVDVMQRYLDDFRALGPLTQGIDINETKTYKLCFPKINGEQFPVFVRIDPDSGRPIYSED